MDQIHIPFPKQGTFTNKGNNKITELQIILQRESQNSRRSFAYNTISTAEEVLNGDVYCTLSD
jgi:hypothetical protein